LGVSGLVVVGKQDDATTSSSEQLLRVVVAPFACPANICGRGQAHRPEAIRILFALANIDNVAAM
jgi:hypothetical protein